jgi:uncharacterized protein (TIGR00730 family)
MPDPYAAHPGDRPPGPTTEAIERMREADPERRFLGETESRFTEFWRALRIAFEFTRGFRRFHFLGACATVFGSARVVEGDPHYELAREVGRALGRVGFTVMTGGGPGVMEAANRGAKDVGAHSAGCNIDLPFEQFPNDYLDTWIQMHYFFVRKVMLVKYSYGFVVLPGGFGTLDEVFETATLIQTGKARDFPVVLMGSDFWTPLIEFMRHTLVAQGKIDAEDLDRLIVTDDPEEAAGYIRDAATRRFGLSYGAMRRRRRWWFLE